MAIDAIKQVGGDLDSWSRVHPFSAVHEALMLAMMNNIQNIYVDFLRYIYMTDIDFTQMMKNGHVSFTKEYTAGLEYVDKNEMVFNFHKIVKIEKE